VTTLEDVLLLVHSQLRWVVLAALLLGGAYALLQAPREAAFRRLPFSVGVGVVDLQVLIGLVLYVSTSGWDEETFVAVIHPIAMVAGAIVAHVGVARAAREEGTRAFQVVGVAFLLALAVIILGIPWA
jgi:hypothetical protein